MSGLMKLSRLIDALNERIGKSIIWLVLIAVLVSTINAIVRKAFDVSSNAFLELQWYLFSGMFLLGGAYALMRNQHVRIDVITGKFSERTQVKLDIFGFVFFLIPVVLLVIYESWPVFVDSFATGEMSSNAGGLILWPARLLVPVGFVMLLLQGFSEIIKRVAFLNGQGPNPLAKKEEKSAEEELAEEIARMREQQLKEGK
ncbi:MAG: C4-dicarboxylate transport system permease, small subunit [Pseudomonadota bacterium]